MNAAIVLDVGTGNARAGLAGGAQPSRVAPTLVGRPKLPRVMMGGALEGVRRLVGDAALQHRGLLSLRRPLERAAVVGADGWEDVVAVWEHALGMDADGSGGTADGSGGSGRNGGSGSGVGGFRVDPRQHPVSARGGPSSATRRLHNRSHSLVHASFCSRFPRPLDVSSPIPPCPLPIRPTSH